MSVAFFVLLAVVGLVLLAGVGVFIWSRYFSRRPGSPATRIPAADAEQRLDLPKIVSNYRARYPAFFRIVTDFQRRHDLEELIVSGDAGLAFQRLAQERPVQMFPSGRSYLNLQPDREHEIKAALLTIVREIYGNPAYCRDLSGQSHLEVDRLLDALTGAD